MTQAQGNKGMLLRNKVNRDQMIMYFTFITMYLFYYFSKYSINPATKPIQDQFGFSSTEFGIVFSAFTFVYAIGQFVNGYICDRFGPKTLMLIGAIGAVVANFLFGLSGSLVLFTFFWCVAAYFLSCGWAPSMKLLFQWFPQEKWGIYGGGSNAFCYLGGAIVLPIAGWCVANWGWRASFFVPSLFTLAWAIVFFLIVKNSPKEAGYEVEWENELDTTKEKVGKDDYIKALCHPQMAAAYACDIFANLIRWGLVNWIVDILMQPRSAGGFGLAVVVASLVASLIHWGGALFSIVSGWMQDKLFHGQRWQTIMIGFLVSGVCIFFLAQGSKILDMPGGMILLCVATFLAGGVIQSVQAPLFNIPGDVLGTRLSGMGVGIMNGWGYFGAIFAGAGLGKIMDVWGYMSAIMVLAGLCFVGAILSLVLKNTSQKSAEHMVSQ